MPDIHVLCRDQWRTLRDLRLSALLKSPHEFLSTYDREMAFSEARWQAEFDRGDWHACSVAGKYMGLLGVTREPGSPADECYLEYLWVSPEFRRSGIAFDMLSLVLTILRTSGIRTVYLWVLDGNDVAVHLYQQAGFVSTHHRQELKARPGRSEEKMKLTLI